MVERGRSADELQQVMVAAIIGGVDGPGGGHLSALISSQIDADKLDYLVRDAHHAGLEIGFDTDRLLARLEVLHVRTDNIDASAKELRERAEKDPNNAFYQIGIAASGFGSFEQMLIGRTFLYDRLYHHHKVRAAEAMAQRLMLIAERDRGTRFDLGEIFMPVGDDTMLRLLAGEVSHTGATLTSTKAAALAKGIINRELLHRAFAFRGRFIDSPPGLSAEIANDNRQVLWIRIVKELDGLAPRFELGQEIHDFALRSGQALINAGIDTQSMTDQVAFLEAVGPEQIIVDLPPLKAEAIRILARYPNGTLRIPEFSFNPAKWSAAYELQKRTGYVFCPREAVALVALASKIIFLGRYGVTMAKEADGYIKAAQTIEQSWLDALVAAQLIDRGAADHLSSKRFSLLAVRPEDLQVPDTWIKDEPDLAHLLAANIGKHLRGGLISDDISALGKVLSALFAFVDQWCSSGRITQDLPGEEVLQELLRQAFAMREISVAEGSVVGGGKLDLFVGDAILIENKFSGESSSPAKLAPAAGMQGRRYAISLDAQVVIVVVGYQPKPGGFFSKSKCVSVRSISALDRNRVEIRFMLPYGAVVPSSEKAD